MLGTEAVVTVYSALHMKLLRRLGHVKLPFG
jgi:hypothetical protein